MVCTFKVELIWLQQDGLHSYYYIYQQLNFNLEVYLTVTLPTIRLSWSSQMWTYCKNQDSRSLEWMSKIWSWMQNVSHQMEAWEIPCSLPAYRITNLSEMTTKTETEVRKRNRSWANSSSYGSGWGRSRGANGRNGHRAIQLLAFCLWVLDHPPLLSGNISYLPNMLACSILEDRVIMAVCQQGWVAEQSGQET